MRFLARRRLRKWNERARPHLERYNRTLTVSVTEENMVGVGDQLDAATDELSDYLRSDPCPVPELAAAYAAAVLIVTSVANVLAAWHRMVPLEQQAAVERTRALGAEADSVACVLARYPFRP